MKKLIVFSMLCLVLASCAPNVAPTAALTATPTSIPVSTTATPVPTVFAPVTSSTTLPNFDHVILIVLENEDYQSVIGSPSMPSLNALANKYVLLSNYFAVTHPSLPNYIALMSGDTQNITSDCSNCFVNAPNLADEIEASGRTWKAYEEDMPSPCYVGDSGKYAQKHDPLIYFDSIRTDATRCDRSIVPLTQLDTDLAANQLPNFSFIMPNLCNSGHDCPVSTADPWVANMVAKLQASPALGNNYLIFITFDEGDTQDTSSCCGMSQKAGGHIASVLISPSAKPGFNDATAYSHYSFLKTILTAWNLPALGQTQQAATQPIEAPWGVSSGSTASNASASKSKHSSQLSVPNPQQLAQGPGCVSSSPTSNSYTVAICFTSPANGSQLTGDVPVTAAVSASGASPGAESVEFDLDGAYLLTAYESPYTFTLYTAKWVDGSHTLTVKAQMRDAFISQPASLTVTFNNGVKTPPVNSSQFQPSTGIPPASGAPFLVAAAGDGASGESTSQKVSDLILSLHPNLFLYLGDVYEDGSSEEFDNWYGTPSTYFDRLRSITDPTVGNHEYLTDGASGYFNYWDNIPNYYSFNANGWHFVSLDDIYPAMPVGVGTPQYQWLQQDLSANTAACTIVFYHEPLFNIGAEGPQPAMADIWKLMAQDGVSIVLNGHDHDYQRWVPLDGNGQPSSQGITEFVAGGAGHGLQNFIKSDPRVAYANDTNPTAFGVLLWQLNPKGANFSYVNSDGSILDSGVIPCVRSGPDTQAPTTPTGLTAVSNSSSKVDLSWTASSDDTGVAGYSIYRNGSFLASVKGCSLTYSDTTAAQATTYNYSIAAFDLAGNYSAQTSAVTVTTSNIQYSPIFQPDADTYVDASSPGTNYGKSASLRVRASPDETGYLRFTISGINPGSIVHAHLLLYANSNSSHGFSAWAVTDNSWDEYATNFNNAPALGSEVASSGPFFAGSWVSLDVTSYVTGNGTYSFGLTSSSVSSISLAGRETISKAPQLVLDLK